MMMGSVQSAMVNRVNIINFIRGVEPRVPIDLTDTLREQLALVKKHNLPATWLIQYDALIDPAFTDLLKREMDASHEIGAWFEVVQPLAEKAGIEWRGRFPWDWHAHVGFSVGYTPQERERLADVFMEEFRAQFGQYPQSVGSWFIDAHLLGYLSDRYGITASCNCKEQWGTDGYTLWGGYYNQAYYPSRLNGFMPAQTTANQIPVPVFRMLGSDPIYQYDAADNGNGQSVVTLEPVYTGEEGGGGVPAWVRWFFNVNFRPEQVSFGYTQVGQENSFGWESMKDGLIDQVELLAAKQAEGVLKVETLADTGKWFKQTYAHTPASAICALTDWKAEGRQSIWYCSKNYRVNLLREQGGLRIRDIQMFDERYEERYLKDFCRIESCVYDTLPIIDGGRWGDGRTKPGMQLVMDRAGEVVSAAVASLEVDESVPGELGVTVNLADGGQMHICCQESGISMRGELAGWGLRMQWVDSAELPDIRVEERAIDYAYYGHPYALRVEGSITGRASGADSVNQIDLCPVGGELGLRFR